MTSGAVGPGRHFCTATVVASPVKDLVITAAHHEQGGYTESVSYAPRFGHAIRSLYRAAVAAARAAG